MTVERLRQLRAVRKEVLKRGGELLRSNEWWLDQVMRKVQASDETWEIVQEKFPYTVLMFPSSIYDDWGLWNRGLKCARLNEGLPVGARCFVLLHEWVHAMQTFSSCFNEAEYYALECEAIIGSSLVAERVLKGDLWFMARWWRHVGEPTDEQWQVSVRYAERILAHLGV